jgi:anti-sigma regulatory factor (Ser/Thr protein kinase)
MAMSHEQTVDLAIRNDVAELATVTETVDRIGAEAGMPFKAVMQLQVVLDEVLSNVIKYAWPEGGSHELRVRINVRDSTVEVLVTDDGRPFDPMVQPPPELLQPGRRPQPGGVGIHMIKQLVDGFEYARVDGYNQVTLSKRYSANPLPQHGQQ